MRILIAEDDFTSRTVLDGVLKKGGHEVTVTVNGLEAWQALQHPDSPSLVILDWMMPGMDGLEVLQRVRALPTSRPPYIIMLTAKGEKADIISGLDAGANDYLTKPFDAGELRARVEVGRRMIDMQNALIESREMLAHQASHDFLTGLPNRRAILDRLSKDMALANRHGNLIAVGMCDIDHFKQVNDTYGHQTGDEILCGLSKILKDNLRPYDSAGRLGGEEFLVVAPMKAGSDCVPFFSRLCYQVSRRKIKTRTNELSLTLSIGVAAAGAHSTVDDILDAADKELYRAKDGGRNRIAYEEKCIIPGDSVRKDSD